MQFSGSFYLRVYKNERGYQGVFFLVSSRQNMKFPRRKIRIFIELSCILFLLGDERFPLYNTPVQLYCSLK